MDLVKHLLRAADDRRTLPDLVPADRERFRCTIALVVGAGDGYQAPPLDVRAAVCGG